MKKLLSLLLAAVILTSAFGAAAASAGGVDVVVTVAENGGCPVVCEALTVTDADGDGIVTVCDAIAAAASKWGDKASLGFGASALTPAYIKYVWSAGYGSAFGCFVNNKPAASCLDVLADGDYVAAFVYADAAARSDRYSFIEQSGESRKDGLLEFYAYYYDAQGEIEPAAGASVYLDGEITGEAVGDDGAFLLAAEPGEHVVSISSEDALYTCGVLRFTVEEVPESGAKRAVSPEYTESANEKLIAPAEDETLELWFDHSFVKREQNDASSTGLYTYTVRMAKNEIEDCQFFLSSPVAHNDLTVEVSDFLGASRLGCEVYWEHYVKMGDNGYMPDPVIPLVQPISLKANKSQAFLVKIKTAADTPAGDYAATLNVKNSAGEIIKTAEIALHVWDFALSEKTSVKTLFGLGRYGIYAAHGAGDDGGALYAKYYDFLLENRICAYDLPYTVDDPRIDEYLDNERVNSFCIGGQGANVTDSEISAYYAKLSQKDEWLDKGIFYYVDEPMTMQAINEIKSAGEHLAPLYPEYKMISPYFMNYEFGGKDMIELMSPYINVWCTKINAWTPQGATGEGVEHMLSDAQIAKSGTYAERMAAEVAGGDENWDYFCWEPIEPYVTFDAAHQGIEQRIAFWQTYDVGATGLLYFAVNEDSGWGNLEKINAGGHPVYGDGTMLYYGAHLHRVKQPKTDDPVGSTRIECIRDGIEDYMYLDMAKELYGDEVVDELVDSVTTSVVDWTKNNDLFQNARNVLGEMLEEKLAEPKEVPDRLAPKAGSAISLDGEIAVLQGISGNVTAAQLVDEFEGGGGIAVYSPEGVELAGYEYVTDGCTVKLCHLGILVDCATVRTVADVNLDGKLNARDVILLMRSIVGWKDDIASAQADVNGDGKANARDVILMMMKIAGGEADFVFPGGSQFKYSGETELKLYTDVPDTDGSRICRAVSVDALGESPSVNFAIPYGQFLKKVTLPVSLAENGGIAVRLEKLAGDGSPKYEWNYYFNLAPGDKVTLDMTDGGAHSTLGAGLYSLVIVSAVGASVTERNAVIRETGYFPGSAGEDDGRETNFEATVTVEYGEDFELLSDVNMSTMLRPVETVIAVPGLTREYTFLHMTDTHLTLSYPEELTTAARQKEHYELNASFTAATGIAPADRYPYFMRYAKAMGVDRILATGDIVSYASQMNVDTAFRDNLEVCGIPYTYCFGNHDWSLGGNYVSLSARKRYANVLFPQYMGGDNFYEQIEYDDLIVISVDDSADAFWQYDSNTANAEKYFEMFKAANEIGKPILLMFHVPLYSETLAAASRAAWSGRDITIGPNTDLNSYSGVTKAMYDMIAGGETNVAAIACGHVHFNHFDYVGSVPQIITGCGYEGYARIIRLVPANAE